MTDLQTFLVLVAVERWRGAGSRVLGVCQYFCSRYILCVHMGACACACVRVEVRYQSALGVVCQVLDILFYDRVSYRPRTH